MKSSPTIKDIAAKLHLHHTTVSRALRDHPDVKEETKQRVRAMAQKMNYQPNYLARSLKRQKSNSIGVIVPEIRHHFFSAVISGIEDVAYQAGFVILVAQSNEKFEREVENTRVFMSNHVAGLIVSISQNTHDARHFKQFIEMGGNLVFFDRVCEDLPASQVVVDDYQGAVLATGHLIEKGYRRIAFIGGTENLSISQRRYQGYLDALQRNGIPFRSQYVTWQGFHEQDGREGMKRLLSLTDPPQAVFAVNDPVAIGAYDVIHERGMRIPQDIALVGFSDNPISAFVNPPLTTVYQPAYEMGKKAAHLLLEQINRKKTGERTIRKEIFPIRLIVRGSA